MAREQLTLGKQKELGELIEALQLAFGDSNLSATLQVLFNLFFEQETRIDKLQQELAELRGDETAPELEGDDDISVLTTRLIELPIPKQAFPEEDE